MKNFKDGGFRKGGNDFGGRPKFGGGSDRGGRDNKPAEMFSATCSDCGKPCQVPFRPSGDRPVYCNDCFAKKTDGPIPFNRNNDRAGEHRPDNFRSDRPDFAKPPRAERPPRHDPSRGAENNELIEVKRQLATMVSRLDRILDLINPPTKPVKKSMTPVVATEEVDLVMPVKSEKKVAVKKAVKKVSKKAVTKKAKSKKK